MAAISINAGDLALASTPGLEVNGRGLQVKTAASLERVAGGLQIAAAALSASGGIIGGGGTALSVNVDTDNGIQLATNKVAIKFKANEGIGVDSNGILVNKTQNYAWTALHTFNTTAPQSSVTPTTSNDLTNKNYVDTQILVAKNDWDFKASANLATTAALPAYDASVPNVLTMSATGVLTIDSVTAALGMRVVVKNETGGNQKYNGIYNVSTAGAVGVAAVLTRSPDADSSSEVTNGMYVFVGSGTVNTASAWVLTTPDPIVLNTTALTFVQFSGLGQISAADASIVINGATIRVGFDANTGLELKAGGAGIKIEANKGLATTGSGLAGVVDANGGVQVDSAGFGIKINAAGSGLLAKTSSGARVATGGVGLPIGNLTEDYAASAFAFGSNLSTVTVAQTPSTHPNVTALFELYKSGAAVMVHVAGVPAAVNEWSFTGTTLRIFGDITASGDTYRIKYTMDV